ncbi:guanine-1-methyltransferase-domain-containing protein [Amylocystis lapponica]|nr:guanine-1-methyltransferase-domain-containing protein [Amylocystis lapponica]
MISAPAQADEPSGSTQPATIAPAPAPPLSKNAQKRLAKAARIAEQKKERRAAEKERKKEKKRQLAEKRAAGELDNDDDDDDAVSRKKRRVGEPSGPKRPFGTRVVVDLGFDEMMTENEIKSLTSQLAFTYSANRKAAQPFASVLFTSLNGRTFSRLEGLNNAAYKRWVDTEWWQQSYEQLWEGTQDTTGAKVDRAEVHPESKTSENVTDKHAISEKDKVVYLTADSADELTELKEDETYIIGGICDHNRYKNLCLNKSQTSGIRSARLPIGTYLSTLRTRKVLTVNQTFEILLQWVETRDWEKALWEVVPKRKFHDRGKPANAAPLRDSEQDASEGEGEVVIDAQMPEEAERDNVDVWDADVDSQDALEVFPVGPEDSDGM